MEIKGFIAKPEGTNRWMLYYDRIDAYLGQIKQNPAVQVGRIPRQAPEQNRKPGKPMAIPKIVSDDEKTGGGLLLAAIGLLALLAVLAQVIGISKVLGIIRQLFMGG
jgi:hypothetical protein